MNDLTKAKVFTISYYKIKSGVVFTKQIKFIETKNEIYGIFHKSTCEYVF